MKSQRLSLDPDDAALQKILKGAAECFRTKGPRKTSMNDIAEAGGIGRQTVYRRFNNKEEVIEAVFEHRARILLEKMLQAKPMATDLEDQIIDACLDWVRRIKQDATLRALVAESDSHDTDVFLIGPRSTLQAIAVQIWTPILEKAKQGGALRPHLTFDEAVHYVRAIHYLLHVRDDLQERERVEFVKNTLLTILIRDQCNKYLRVTP